MSRLSWSEQNRCVINEISIYEHPGISSLYAKDETTVVEDENLQSCV